MVSLPHAGAVADQMACMQLLPLASHLGPLPLSYQQTCFSKQLAYLVPVPVLLAAPTPLQAARHSARHSANTLPGMPVNIQSACAARDLCVICALTSFCAPWREARSMNELRAPCSICHMWQHSPQPGSGSTSHQISIMQHLQPLPCLE